MQKNVPKYTPDWVQTVPVWAEASKREVSYALCNDRRTLLWFANQRAVEYHPTLVAGRPTATTPTHLVLDLDPPRGRTRSRWRSSAAQLVRQALADAGLAGAVKTSGAKGVHVFVPLDDAASIEDVGRRHPGDRRPGRAARPGARHHGVHQGGPRRQGVRRLDPRRRGDRGRRLQPAGPARRAGVVPGRLGRPRPTSPRRDFTIRTALALLGDGDPWAELDARTRSRCPPT